jgi:rRNA maturation RNase YbeY
MSVWSIPVIKNRLDVQIYVKDSLLSRKQIISYLKKIVSIVPELKDYFITVAIIDDTQMQKLNYKFTGRESPTDVLSFKYEGEIPTIEVIVSSDQALKNASRYKNAPSQELLIYIVHGILHGLGYEDNNKSNRVRMFRKQREIVNRVWNE